MDDYRHSITLDPHDTRWMDFISNCSNANIFHHPSWLDLISECYGYKSFVLALADSQGNIRAGLPMMEVKNVITGHRLVSLPFTDYCSPLYCDDSELVHLIDQIMNIFRSQQPKRIEIRWKLPENTQQKYCSEYVLHTIPLSQDPDQVAKGFKRSHLQNIRQAQERGVKVQFCDDYQQMRDFYDIQVETRKRHGLPSQPWKFFELLWQIIIRNNLGFILLARKDRELLAGMVYLSWGKTLIAKYAASREGSFNLRPNNLLFWEGICWGCNHGYTLFDMGRTERENQGLRDFKCRWGAKEESLDYSIITSKPYQQYNGQLMKIMHSIINKSPSWVCRRLGEIIYRYYG